MVDEGLTDPTPRIIERAAYPSFVPEPLADLVPTWSDIQRLPDRSKPNYTLKRNPSWGERWDLSGHGANFFAITDTEVRWWISVGIAHSLGLPSHWYDLGLRPCLLSDRWAWDNPVNYDDDAPVLYVWPPTEPGRPWTGNSEDGLVSHATEFEARCWAADQLTAQVTNESETP